MLMLLFPLIEASFVPGSLSGHPPILPFDVLKEWAVFTSLLLLKSLGIYPHALPPLLWSQLGVDQILWDVRHCCLPPGAGSFFFDDLLSCLVLYRFFGIA